MNPAIFDNVITVAGVFTGHQTVESEYLQNISNNIKFIITPMLELHAGLIQAHNLELFL